MPPYFLFLTTVNTYDWTNIGKWNSIIAYLCFSVFLSKITYQQGTLTWFHLSQKVKSNLFLQPCLKYFKSVYTFFSTCLTHNPTLVTTMTSDISHPNKKSRSQDNVIKCKSSLPPVAFPFIPTHCAADPINKVSGSSERVTALTSLNIFQFVALKWRWCNIGGDIQVL